MGSFCPGGFCPGDFCQGGFCLGDFCQGGFCPGDFCQGGFCPGDFCPVPVFHIKLQLVKLCQILTTFFINKTRIKCSFTLQFHYDFVY